MKLILIGLRGAGKTTIGRLAAERLGWPFTDLDDLTRAELAGGSGAGPSISDLWRLHGEASFRQAEVRALASALKIEGPGVLALGGGTPTAAGAVELLREAKTRGDVVIYLRSLPPTLRRRLSADAGGLADRPSLTGADPLAEMDAVFAARDPLYVDLAEVTLNTDAEDAQQTAARIAMDSAGKSPATGGA